MEPPPGQRIWEEGVEAEANEALSKQLLTENHKLHFDVYILMKKLDNQVEMWQVQKQRLESQIKDLFRRLRVATLDAAESIQRHKWELRKKTDEAASLLKKLAVEQEKLKLAEAEKELQADRLAQVVGLLDRFKEAANIATEDRDEVLLISQKYKEDATELMKAYKAKAMAAEGGKAQALKELQILRKKGSKDNGPNACKYNDDNLKEWQERERALEAAMKRKEKEASLREKKMVAEFASKQSRHDEERSAKDKELAKLKREIEELKAKVDELDGLQNGIDRAGEEELDAVVDMVTRDSAEHEISSLKEDLTRANSLKESLESQVKKAKEELSKARHELREAQEVAQKQSPDVAALVSEKWTLLGEVAAVKGQLQQTQKKFDDMRKKYLLEHVRSGNEGRREKSSTGDAGANDSDKGQENENPNAAKDVAKVQGREVGAQELDDLEKRLKAQEKKLASALRKAEAAKKMASEAEKAKAENAWLREQLTAMELKQQEASKKVAKSNGRLTRNLNEEMEAVVDNEQIKKLHSTLETFRKVNAELELKNAELSSKLAAVSGAHMPFEAHGSQDPDFDMLPTQEVRTEPPPPPAAHGLPADKANKTGAKDNDQSGGITGEQNPFGLATGKPAGFSDGVPGEEGVRGKGKAGSDRPLRNAAENAGLAGQQGEGDGYVNVTYGSVGGQATGGNGASGIETDKDCDLNLPVKGRVPDMAANPRGLMEAEDAENMEQQMEQDKDALRPAKRTRKNVNTNVNASDTDADPHKREAKRTPLASLPTQANGEAPPSPNQLPGAVASSFAKTSLQSTAPKPRQSAAKSMDPPKPPSGKGKARVGPSRLSLRTRGDGAARETSPASTRPPRGSVVVQGIAPGGTPWTVGDNTTVRRKRKSSIGSYATPARIDLRAASLVLASRQMSQGSDASGPSTEKSAFWKSFVNPIKPQSGWLKRDPSGGR